MTRWTMTGLAKLALGVFLLLAAAGGARALLHEPPRHNPVADMTFAPYAPQKVVYHVLSAGGRGDRYYEGVLGSALNQIKAVGASRIDMRFVLQSKGVELLADAMTDRRLAQRVDELRRDGVRFEVCHNTLLDRNINPFTDLYHVKREDIVAAGVAEVTALQMQGFAYLRY